MAAVEILIGMPMPYLELEITPVPDYLMSIMYNIQSGIIALAVSCIDSA